MLDHYVLDASKNKTNVYCVGGGGGLGVHLKFVDSAPTFIVSKVFAKRVNFIKVQFGLGNMLSFKLYF